VKLFCCFCFLIDCNLIKLSWVSLHRGAVGATEMCVPRLDMMEIKCFLKLFDVGELIDDFVLVIPLKLAPN
jgi:hypothetical protein